VAADLALLAVLTGQALAGRALRRCLAARAAVT
jgi:hypothetical protein